jgi:hypothetical protein
LFQILRDLWSHEERISEEDNEDLIRPFYFEEFKNGLFSMEVNKAPRLDNIRVEFYQHFGEVVKFDIINLFTAFHQGNLDVQRLNYGIMTLLPKSNEGIHPSGLLWA